MGRKRREEELRVKNEENGGGKSTDIDCRAEPLPTGETGEGLPRPPVSCLLNNICLNSCIQSPVS